MRLKVQFPFPLSIRVDMCISVYIKKIIYALSNLGCSVLCSRKEKKRCRSTVEDGTSNHKLSLIPFVDDVPSTACI